MWIACRSRVVCASCEHACRNDSSTPVHLEEWYRLLLKEMAHERIEPRRNRVNPRVVKRKMSKFAKKRPEHRHRPPLTKTFAQTVVIR